MAKHVNYEAMQYEKFLHRPLKISFLKSLFHISVNTKIYYKYTDDYLYEGRIPEVQHVSTPNGSLSGADTS
jgi:hypothetical protein